MADHSRVPAKIFPFYDYVLITDNFLQAIDAASSLPNWQRLGLLSTQAAQWHTRRGKLDTLFAIYENPVKCTSVTRQDLRDFMKAFRKFAMPLLNLIAASANAGPNEEAVFNFKIGRRRPGRTGLKIADSITFSVEMRTNGYFHFRCRTGHESKRGKKAPGADSVQLAYRIFNSREDMKDGAILNVDVGFTKEIFTTSKFHFEVGGHYSGKWIVFYARWFNTKHRHLAGTWSDMHTCVVG